MVTEASTSRIDMPPSTEAIVEPSGVAIQPRDPALENPPDGPATTDQTPPVSAVPHPLPLPANVSRATIDPETYWTVDGDCTVTGVVTGVGAGMVVTLGAADGARVGAEEPNSDTTFASAARWSGRFAMFPYVQ